MPNLYFNEEMFIGETLTNFVKFNAIGFAVMLIDMLLACYIKYGEVDNVLGITFVSVIGVIGTITLVKAWVDLMIRRRYLQGHYGSDVKPTKFASKLASIVPKLYVKENYGLKMQYLLIPLISIWCVIGYMVIW